MRHLLVFLLVLISGGLSAAAHSGEVVCREQFKTSNNCYRLNQPDRPPLGLVVLLPYYGSDANEFSSAALPELLKQKQIATMTVSAAGYLADEDLKTLKALIAEVTWQLKIPEGALVVGGISAGGTGAVRYAEYCVPGNCESALRPAAVFSVDAPLDFESWWNRHQLNLRRANPKSYLDESGYILEALRAALGGSPTELPQAYRSRSPFLVTDKNGGNAGLLKNLPIRLYTEPDVVWAIENMACDYYTLNAVDQAALVLQLRNLGNNKADLITTSGKGFRPPGTRNPHSWSIVDEPDLALWIAACLRH